MAPVTQATDAGAIEKLVVDAALAIASKAGWEQLRLHAIADRTGRPLAEIGRRFRDVTVEPGLGPEHHQREQAEQHRRGARDSQLGPLSLGFDTEMPAHFRERHLDRPAPHEPAEHVERIGIRVSTEEGLRLELTRNIAHQKPSVPAASIRSVCRACSTAWR